MGRPLEPCCIRVWLMALAIKAEGIFKTFRSGWWKKREKEALKGVDLQIEEGEIFGILGPNGEGKTTLLSILCTLLLPDRGKVRVLGNLLILKHVIKYMYKQNEDHEPDHEPDEIDLEQEV